MTAGPRPPRVLLVAMYPLDAGTWGPTVRITHLRDELARFVSLDVIDGYRTPRRVALWRYAASGRLRSLDGIYVESSSFLPAETDLAFLALGKALGIPILTYFRDAYQLFPDYYPIDSLRRWVAARAFPPAMRALAAASSITAAPTHALGRVLFGDRWRGLALPPGAPEPAAVPYQVQARTLLHVGAARLPAHGVRTLLQAVERVRTNGQAVNVALVARVGEEVPAPHPAWLRIERGSADEIRRLLPGVAATVIPRPRSAYNDLALPIKLFDYLSYGRPLLVTPCPAQAEVVERARAGLVIPDDAQGMAAAISGFLSLPAAERESMARAASGAASTASWRSRAVEILAALGLEPAVAAGQRAEA